MRLFGEQGYAATSVAQIEDAAGLRPGAGGLYAHYRSKEALLRAGLEALLTPTPDLALTDRPAPTDGGPVAELPAPVSHVDESSIGEPSGPAEPDSAEHGSDRPSPSEYAALVRELEEVVRAGLARLQHDRDYNRILVRDLRALPDLLEMSADREIRPLHDQLEAYLSSPSFRLPDGAHPRALAAVLIGATSNFWLLSDVFGEYPAGVSEDQYVSALARLAAGLITPERDS